MTAELTIKDFQSHERTLLTINGLTIVTGPSNSGKSSIVRALKVLANNSRSADFVRHGAPSGTASVDLHTGTHQIAIHRGKGVVRYDLDGTRYEKVGATVPDAVSKALGLSDANFASQFDRPFLLDASSTDIARTIGELTNVGKIIAAAKEAARRKRAAGDELRSLALTVTRANEKLERLEEWRTTKARLELATEELGAAEITETVAKNIATLAETHHTLTVGLAALPQPKDTKAADGLLNLAEEELTAARHIATLLATHRQAKTQHGAERQIAAQCHAKAEELEHNHHLVLVQAGKCPTCGQKVK